MKYLLLLLYLWLGDDGRPVVQFNQREYGILMECRAEGSEIALKLSQEKRFLGGILAQCIEMPIMEF